MWNLKTDELKGRSGSSAAVSDPAGLSTQRFTSSRHTAAKPRPGWQGAVMPLLCTNPCQPSLPALPKHHATYSSRSTCPLKDRGMQGEMERVKPKCLKLAAVSGICCLLQTGKKLLVVREVGFIKVLRFWFWGTTSRPPYLIKNIVCFTVHLPDLLLFVNSEFLALYFILEIRGMKSYHHRQCSQQITCW